MLYVKRWIAVLKILFDILRIESSLGWELFCCIRTCFRLFTHNPAGCFLFHTVITLCLYNIKSFVVILLSLYKRGVGMATNKIQTGIRFEPELLYKITQIAKENKRSLNAQLEYLAQLCVREFESEHGEIPVDEELLYKK